MYSTLWNIVIYYSCDMLTDWLTGVWCRCVWCVVSPLHSVLAQYLSQWSTIMQEFIGIWLSCSPNLLLYHCFYRNTEQGFTEVSVPYRKTQNKNAWFRTLIVIMPNVAFPERERVRDRDRESVGRGACKQQSTSVRCWLCCRWVGGGGEITRKDL